MRQHVRMLEFCLEFGIGKWKSKVVQTEGLAYVQKNANQNRYLFKRDKIFLFLFDRFI
jgi:hypothetical protein